MQLRDFLCEEEEKNKHMKFVFIAVAISMFARFYWSFYTINTFSNN